MKTTIPATTAASTCISSKITVSIDNDIDTLIEAGVVYEDFREDLSREQAGRD